MICQGCLLSVVAIDPLTNLCLSPNHAKFVSLFLAKTVILGIGVVHTLSQMWMETKMNHDLGKKKSASAVEATFGKKPTNQKADLSKMFAQKVKELN